MQDLVAAANYHEIHAFHDKISHVVNYRRGPGGLSNTGEEPQKLLAA